MNIWERNVLPEFVLFVLSFEMPAVASSLPDNAIVHPLVLLSAVDHYNRVAKNTRKRVVGILLGQRIGNSVNISNSYAGAFTACARLCSSFNLH
jgi:hypothetical protein